MSPETPRQDGFGFTEAEQLYDRISHARLEKLIGDQATEVHRVELSGNTYGEFLFVTASRPAGEQRAYVTFWGMGLHEYRDRWLTDEWFWHQTQLTGKQDELVMDKAEVAEILRRRLEEIASAASRSRQSRRGQLFELMAELTDDDGAVVDMEDFGEWLLGDDDE